MLQQHLNTGQTPVGSMPQAHAIYGQSSSNHNRNYRGNKSKHAADGKTNIIQSKRSAAGGGLPLANNPNQQKPMHHHSSVDHHRMQNFKNNMKEI